MTERRPLSAGVQSIPNADPEAVRQFLSQDRAPSAEAPELSLVGERPPRSQTTEQPARRRKSKPSGVTPIGLIPVTVRLRPDVAGALKRASLERQLTGDDLFTQQDIVQSVLEPWLRSEGCLL